MNAILYAAKSTSDEHGSIPAQLADGRGKAAAERWIVLAEYSDEAASAWTGDRGPELAAAMKHAERVAPCVFLVQHSDRLARGDGRTARHLGEIYFWALKADVELRSVQDDSTFTNPLLTFAMGERNAEDSRRKSLAVAAGMTRRAEKGLANGGPRPLGYQHPGDGTAMAIVEAEQVIVVRIFDEFIAGRSLRAIAGDLHREGISTVRGGFWRQSTVTGILRNPVYIGKMRHLGQIYDGQHKPIISMDTWQRAQDLLAARPSKGRGRPPKGRHLFRGGMLRCECGAAILSRTNGGYAFYYCQNRAAYGPGECRTPHIRRVDLDQAVYRYFEQVALDVQATRDAIDAGHNRRLAEIRALRLEAEQEAHRAAERLARVRRDYVDGSLDAADWQSFRDELTPLHEAATAAADRLASSEASIQVDMAMVDAEQEMVQHLAGIRRAIAGEVQSTDSVDTVRAALRRLFSMFILHRGVPAGRVHVELIGEHVWIEPVVREEAVQALSNSRFPILRREPVCPFEKNNTTASRCARTSRSRSIGWSAPRAATGSA